MKFLYLLTVLSLNSNVFCYFYLLVKTPLHCINLQREGATLNLETLLKTRRNKILRRSLTPLWFLDFATAYSYFNDQMCSDFIVGNKIFCFFKKWVFAFLGLLIKTGSDRFRNFFFLGGGLGKKGWGQNFRVRLIPWGTLCTML